MKSVQDDRRHETTKPATVEITEGELKEKKDKLIQKETMETGSVSITLSLSLTLSLQSKINLGQLECLSHLHSCMYHSNGLSGLCHVYFHNTFRIRHQYLVIKMDGSFKKDNIIYQ